MMVEKQKNSVFKYKSINGQIEYLLDILYNKKIYLPTIKELNDPMEGVGKLYFSYAGSGYYAGTSRLPSIYEETLSEYRILSLSEDNDNWVMWSHYADCFKGICLEFSNSGALSNIEKVNYIDEYEEIFCESDEDIRATLRNKTKDWAYENEWRLIVKSDQNFLKLEKNDLLCLIVGEKVPTNTRRCLKEICDANSIEFKVAYVDPYKCIVDFKSLEDFEIMLKQMER